LKAPQPSPVNPPSEALRDLRERNRYMKGLFAWIGYP
jgi:hypothetical protein